MKFLKGKVWQIVLALCMLVTLLCITASGADSEPTSVTFYLGKTGVVVQRGATVCYTNDASGKLTEIAANSEDYNVKATYPADGTPIVYLRDAYVKTLDNVEAHITKDKIASKTTFVVEKTATETITVDSNVVEADSYISTRIEWTGGELVIEGRGGSKLRVDSSTNMIDQAITYKNLNLEVRSGSSFVGTPTMITFDGGTANMVNSYLGLNFYDSPKNSTQVEGFTITNNADVYWECTTGQVIYGAGRVPNAKVLIESGSLVLKTSAGTARVVQQYGPSDNMFDIRSGTLEIINEGSGNVGVGTISADKYLNAEDENVYRFVSGTDANNVAQQDPGEAVNQKYMKFEAAYKVAVTDGTTSHTTAPVGATVTLTPADKGEIVFDQWVVAEDSAKIKINEDSGVYTFVMPEGNVKVTADYIEKATISLAGTDYTFTEGEDLYFETDSNGGVTKLENVQEGTVPKYQIKLGFVEEVPTVFLKNATITTTQTGIKNAANTPEFVIKTEAASTISQTDNVVDSNGKYSAVNVTGQVTFKGSALLTLKGRENAFYGNSSAKIIFEGANVNLEKTEGKDWGEAAFSGSVSEITFTGGTVNIKSSYMGLFSNPANGMTVTAEKNTIVDVNCGHVFSWNQTKLIVNNSRLNIAGGSNDNLFQDGSSTVSVENGGDLELKKTSGKKGLLVNAPDLSKYKGEKGEDYQGEYYAVMGDDASTAEVYEGTPLSGKYFRIGKKATVTVTGGTAKAFGESSTAKEGTTHELVTMIGADVTLTAGDASDGKTFYKWVDTTSGATFTGVNAATGTFTATQNVNVTAIFGKQASVTIAGTARSVFQGYDALYFTTTDGTVALGGDERTYNIKFVYPTGDGATPKLYLRGAYLTQAIASNDNTVPGTAIIVEKVGNYPSTVPDSAVEKGEAKPDSYITVGISWTNMALTIQGYEGNNNNPALADMGKLKMTLTAGKIASVGSAYQLTFKDLDLTATTTAVSLPSSVTFDGGKASITSTTAVYQIWPSTTDTTSTGVRVTGGADVSLVGGGNTNTICIYNSTSSKVIIEKDSKLKVVSSNAKEPLRADDAYNGGMHDVLQVKGGTLEAISTNSSTAGFGTTYARMSGYDDTFFAINGTSVTDSAEIQLNKYSYFKVEPAYTISVSNGTASVATDRVTVANAMKAPVGATVTLTPAAQSGHRFYKWTYGQNSQKPPITNNAFTMPKGTVSVEANYDEIKTIKILGTAYDFTVHEPLYFTTVDGAVDPLTKGDLEKQYNIKLAVDDEGVPTVFLKGATIKTDAGDAISNDANDAGISNLVVVVKSESTITSGGRGFYLLNSNMTITGPGKLSILTQGNEYSYGSGIVFENNTKEGKYVLTFDDANVLVDAGGKDTSAIFEIRRDIDVIIDGGTVELKSVFHNWNSYTYKTDNVPNEGENANGKNNVPQIKGDWTAIQGDSTTYWGYSSGTLLDQRYFKVEPKVVEVTITWGAMSFTYTGSIWNVETHQWEGRWEPTVSDDSEAVGMDGYDSALASNQIKVVNSGTVTVNVSFRFNSDANFGNSYGTVNGAFVARKPYYLSNWDPVDSSEFPNIWSKAYFWATRDDTKVTVSYNGKTGIPAMAAELKRVFDLYPDNSNMRIINITAVELRFLSEQTDDVVFMENGVAELAAWMDEFLAEYERIGGKLDGIYSDLEYIDGFYSYLQRAYRGYEEKDEKGNTIIVPPNTDVYRDIIDNPYYLKKVRPQLKARGFEFETNYTGPDKEDFGELYSLEGSGYTDSKRIWDTVIRDLLCDYLDEAIYKPLNDHYPKAYFTDYQSRDTYGWMKLLNGNTYNTYRGGNTQKAGTHSSYNAYNYEPQWVTTKSETDTSYKKPVSYNGAVFEDNAFHMTQWETNNFKAMYAATESKKLEITLTYYDYAVTRREEWRNNKDATSSGTPYHIEGYLHAGLLDPEFGGYVIRKEIEDANKPETIGKYEERLQVISDIMRTLSHIVGYSDRKPIETPLNWNDSFILSGMYANGRNVWRITPDTISGVSKEEFLVKDDGEVIFSNKGQTITFPQGSIISEPITFPVGTCGYWVETPADVMPIVTNEKNRYEEYPAYVETFDNYTVGEAFSSQYSHTWELGGSSATIQQNGDDKVLAIRGNATLNNIKLPEYITAGDNYAKQQIWETTFSLSSLPTGNAQAKLLVATSGSGTDADGGFRISNSTLYYSTASGYQEFDKFSLSENTEYTLKRVVDFDAFTCSYYVYDANGSELAMVENVSMANVQLPVTKINFSTENFGSNTLYVDNYKLYATGVTTDLEVYNADTGIQVDASVARKGNTAYRLSWMNASSVAKIYNVVATYSDGTKEILNSIEMQPGCDGVNTGIVKLADGKSVTISLEETTTKVPDAGDNAGDDGSSNGSNSASGEDTTITLIRSQEADVYLYLSSGSVASFPSGTTLGTVTVTINAITPAQEGGNA